MKILIVEDEPSLCELMARTLRKEQYVVETASTFTEASERLGVYSYDCVLLDIMLPDGNGLRLLEELKMQDKRENVIIISSGGGCRRLPSQAVPHGRTLGPHPQRRAA